MCHWGEWVDYYGLDICIPFQFICSNPNPQYDMWRWGLCKVIRSWKQSPRDEISARTLSRRPGSCASSLPQWGCSKKTNSHKPGTLILDFPATRIRKINLSCLSHPIYNNLLQLPNLSQLEWKEAFLHVPSFDNIFSTGNTISIFLFLLYF